ncbi:hypothetical protein B0H16DRAFT_1467327 [Mycena metata]|uniref:Uncharacterized protein n=1 Tax=Mycena metata TaxID=1033252 RepID=A0AAD7I4T3_9AGAR|nr:hypothetical protein B0H16DRAFT_1467327 [Mycena metata]
MYFLDEHEREREEQTGILDITVKRGVSAPHDGAEAAYPSDAGNASTGTPVWVGAGEGTLRVAVRMRVGMGSHRTGAATTATTAGGEGNGGGAAPRKRACRRLLESTSPSASFLPPSTPGIQWSGVRKGRSGVRVHGDVHTAAFNSRGGVCAASAGTPALPQQSESGQDERELRRRRRGNIYFYLSIPHIALNWTHRTNIKCLSAFGHSSIGRKKQVLTISDGIKNVLLSASYFTWYRPTEPSRGNTTGTNVSFAVATFVKLKPQTKLELVRRKVAGLPQIRYGLSREILIPHLFQQLQKAISRYIN